MIMISVHRSVCHLDCPDACGLLIHIDDGQVVKCSGDPEHPFTRGVICAKMSTYPRVVHSPERLLSPLRRTGPKGSGKFETITWEEALEIIVSRWGEIISSFGGEAILPFSYAGVMGLIQRNAGQAFFHRLGASRLQRTICSAAAASGWELAMGQTRATDPESIVHSDFIVLWGINGASTNMHLMLLIQEARKKGARAALIETHRSRTSRLVDQVYLVKPGTDGALALGLMNVLVEEGLVDEEFIRQYVEGYDQFVEKVLPRYTPQQVEEITGLPAEEVIGLARAYGQARAPFLRIGAGLSRTRRGAATVRAISCLPALKGAFGKKGGGALLSVKTTFDLSILTRPDLGPRPVRELNMNQLGRILTSPLEPPIKSLYVYHSNPAAVLPDQNKVLAGLAREDLFTVVHERFLTDTALYADVVLPATTSLEQDDLYQSYGHYYLQLARRILAPPGEARSNWQVFSSLARAFDFREEIFSWTEEEAIKQLLSRSSPLREGITYDLLAEGKPVRLRLEKLDPYHFDTPSGKIEIASPRALSLGQTLLPDYVEREDEVDDVYPFHLLPVPGHFTLNSNFCQDEDLKRREGGPR
ncbi:MAG TPA: molybdopterin-dependent oxidoreductase, partial [Clostridia bacterium]|nr:molybdopterin-dependent oxidoreductase [Clostridia bacterium]